MIELMNETLAQRLAGVQHQIKLAAEKAGRRADEITLIPVSKTHPAATATATAPTTWPGL